MSLVNFLKFVVREEFVYITGAALHARAKRLGRRKKLKCKMVCYLMLGRSVETRCYRYVGNGLSHLGAQIRDLLSPLPLRDIIEVFIIMSARCHLSDSSASPQPDAQSQNSFSSLHLTPCTRLMRSVSL